MGKLLESWCHLPQVPSCTDPKAGANLLPLTFFGALQSLAGLALSTPTLHRAFGETNAGILKCFGDAAVVKRHVR